MAQAASLSPAQLSNLTATMRALYLNDASTYARTSSTLWDTAHNQEAILAFVLTYLDTVSARRWGTVRVDARVLETAWAAHERCGELAPRVSPGIAADTMLFALGSAPLLPAVDDPAIWFEASLITAVELSVEYPEEMTPTLIAETVAEVESLLRTAPTDQ